MANATFRQTPASARNGFWPRVWGLIKGAPVFFGLFLGWLTGGGFALWVYGPNELFLLVNRWRSPYADPVFAYGTHLGEGFGLAILLVITLFIALKRTALAAAVFVTSGLVSLIAKAVLWPGKARPYAYFRTIDEHLVQTVDGAKLYSTNSFPSGHTITAFALFGLLAVLYGKRPWASVLLFGGAVLVAWSRLYLGQHFFEDVYAGSAIGMAVMVLITQWLDPLLNDRRWAGWRLGRRSALPSPHTLD